MLLSGAGKLLGLILGMWAPNSAERKGRRTHPWSDNRFRVADLYRSQKNQRGGDKDMGGKGKRNIIHTLENKKTRKGEVGE